MLVKGNAFFKLLEFYDSYRKNFYKKTCNLSVNVQIHLTLFMKFIMTRTKTKTELFGASW